LLWRIKVMINNNKFTFERPPCHLSFLSAIFQSSTSTQSCSTHHGSANRSALVSTPYLEAPWFLEGALRFGFRVRYCAVFVRKSAVFQQICRKNFINRKGKNTNTYFWCFLMELFEGPNSEMKNGLLRILWKWRHFDVCNVVWKVKSR